MKKLIIPLISLTLIFLSTVLYFSFDKESPTVKEKNPGYFLDLEVQKGYNKILDLAVYYADLLDNLKSSVNKTTGSTFVENIKELGPANVGGRTRALQFDLNDSNRIFAGSVSGGMWVSEDKGNSWNPINDFETNLGVTSITQSPVNPQILYYSTGEVRGNSANVFGQGVFKSIDGGKSFFHLGGSRINGVYPNTWKIVASPIDENTVYLATHTEGLVRSTDGGESFHFLLSGNITDVEVLPNGEVFAGIKGVGIYKSQDGEPGTFLKAESNLPGGEDFSRVEIAFCESVPTTMYAAFVNKEESTLLDLFKSVDGGTTWTTKTNPRKRGISFLFPWYCLALEVKPSDPNYLIIGSVNLGFSLNGGVTWVKGGNSHADYHIFKFDPNNEDKLLVGNDGGIYEYSALTLNLTPKSLNNGFVVSQYYAGDFHPTSDVVIGGTQDNGTNLTSSLLGEFEEINGGDGGFSFINQQNPNIAYSTAQYGYITKTTNLGFESPNLKIILNELDSDGDFQVDEGTWFVNPFSLNKHNGEQLFYTTLKRVWRSNNGGDKWEELTNEIGEDRDKAPFALGLSNDLEPKLYIAGSGGIFYRIDDATTATPGDEVDLSASIPEGLKSDFFRNITVNPNDPSQIFIALSNLSTKSRIFRVDFADTDNPAFVDISGNLPRNLPVNWVQVSQENSDYIVAGTDFGLYSSSTGGDSWNRVMEFPNVVIYNLKLRQSDQKLFIFTHGRGVWSADVNTLVSGVNSNMVETVSVYPNPTSKSISLNNENSTTDLLEVLNLQGMKMAQQEISSSNSTMDISHLPTGTYIVHGKFKGRIVAEGKFVKID